MTLDEAGAAIDRLVLDLARATGRPEALVRLGYGLDPAPDRDAADGPAPARRDLAA